MGRSFCDRSEGRGLCGAELPQAESRGVAAKTARWLSWVELRGVASTAGRGFPEVRAEGRGFRGAE